MSSDGRPVFSFSFSAVFSGSAGCTDEDSFCDESRGVDAEVLAMAACFSSESDHADFDIIEVVLRV